METQQVEARRYVMCTKDEIGDMKSFLRDHIICEIEDNTDGHIQDAPRVASCLAITVDDYAPAAGEQWDVDQWENRQGFIYAPASREHWRRCWRAARALARGMKLRMPDGAICELPCLLVVEETPCMN